MNKLLLIFLLLTGCSTMIPVESTGYPTVEVTCKAQHCPSINEIQRIVDIFSSEVPAFEINEVPLIIEWYPVDYAFYNSDGMIIIGQTLSEDHIQVTSNRVMVHELFHVHFMRLTGDPDNNHEHQGGPWTNKTNEEIRRIELLVEKDNPNLVPKSCE